MLALIEVGSLFLHFPLAGLLHWGLLFLAVAEVRPCLVYCFVNCGQTCSRFNRYPLFNFMQAQYYFALFKSTFLAIMARPFNAGRTGRTSWKVAPRLWQFQWDGAKNLLYSDLILALTRLQCCTCSSGWTLTFFPSEVWFFYNCDFWQLLLQLPSWVISLSVLYWHLSLKSMLMVFNQPCFCSPNLKYTILRRGLLYSLTFERRMFFIHTHFTRSYLLMVCLFLPVASYTCVA